jgi:hypothetical protein
VIADKTPILRVNFYDSAHDSLRRAVAICLLESLMSALPISPTDFYRVIAEYAIA